MLSGNVDLFFRLKRSVCFLSPGTKSSRCVNGHSISSEIPLLGGPYIRIKHEASFSIEDSEYLFNLSILSLRSLIVWTKSLIEKEPAIPILIAIVQAVAKNGGVNSFQCKIQRDLQNHEFCRHK